MTIPFLDLKAQNVALRDEILAEWGDILDNAAYVGGARVSQLEEDFAAACGVSDCAAVCTGTDALILLMKALGLKTGDEVIVPANTFIATAEAVIHAGGKVVFADVESETYNLCPEAAAAAVTANTVGIIGVHLYGQPCDADALQAVADKHGLWFLEDSAQAHLATYKGRKAGSLGTGAGFSFYPGKNLGAPGEGGAVTSNDSALIARIRQYREHGQAQKYIHEYVGYNCRMPTVMASALTIKLRHLQAWTDRRNAAAQAYGAGLAGVEGVELPRIADQRTHAFHLYVVHVKERDQVRDALQEKGIASGIHYPIPCHLQPCFADAGYEEGQFPVSEYNASHCVSLPMFPELTSEQVAYVCEGLKQAIGR